MDYTIKIGGEAGQGIQTIGDALAKVLSRLGYHVFTNQDYESRIRGGHNFYQIRLADQPVYAPRRDLDILVAFDRASITLHEREVAGQGIIVYDSLLLKESFKGPQFFDVPFAKLAADMGAERIAANTVATGTILGMLGFPLDPLFEIIKGLLKKKDDGTREQNRLAAIAGYEHAVKNCGRCAFTLHSTGTPRMLVGANDAIGFGALAGGCGFYSAYPMTPSTGIMLFLSSKAKEYGMVVEQAEDEIAAINMALGASFAGVRSMTGTSGGGFALMTEGLSLAAMTETPIVIALAQRPGPATGLPTKTEQADLLFALNAGHGEFPRVIFAPGDPRQALSLTAKAFDLSQKYQVPVFVMTDQYLSDTQWTMESFSVDDLPMHDYRAAAEELDGFDGYRRHAFTSTGVSPFGIPGKTRHVVVTDSDEHGEAGHIIEDAETRKKMVEKRLFLKVDAIRDEISPPLFLGSEEPETVLVSWGSTYGVVREAVELMAEKKMAMLHFSEIFPFPRLKDHLEVLKRARRTISIENNATGQFARLLKDQTGYGVTDMILRYDGRPFLVEELLEELSGRT
ncbi:MAG: 2-oxoacid:acceptor oxidoreductase subunit alpha [Syntrophorhabdaceae bacterium]|nr:2-oxoacid:acceptor oxidoreductase subunit alpha [Syntrophorhabdaceae bacterium]